MVNRNVNTSIINHVRKLFETIPGLKEQALGVLYPGVKEHPHRTNNRYAPGSRALRHTLIVAGKSDDEIVKAVTDLQKASGHPALDAKKLVRTIKSDQSRYRLTGSFEQRKSTDDDIEPLTVRDDANDNGSRAVGVL